MKKPLQIRTAREYRHAVTEVQRLEEAKAGTAEFRRRHDLLAAMHQYELRHLNSDLNPGRPAP